MSNLIQFPDNFAPVSFSDYDPAQDPGAGATGGSFPVLSIQGKVFRIKNGGVQTKITDDRGLPIQQLNVVIVAENLNNSRTYYEGGFDASANLAPTCSSTDGIRPDAYLDNPQAMTCVSCPRSQRDQVTPGGAHVSACSNHRRIAIVPEGDFDNEAFGGAMLLRVPGGSLKNYYAYTNYLRSRRVPFYGVVTALTFDINAAHPRLVFQPVRTLTQGEGGEYEQIKALRETDQVNAVIGKQIAVEPINFIAPPAPAPVAPQPAPQPTVSASTFAPKVATPVVVNPPVTTPVEKAAPVQATPKPRAKAAPKSQITEAVADPVEVSPIDQILAAKLDAIAL